MDGLTDTELATIMLVFRVVLGLVFASHGWAKRFRGGRIEGTGRWFDSIGMKPGKLHANAASTAEMATGLLLALGLLTPFAAAGMIGVMLVAAWTVHRSNGFFIVGDGWEYTFMVGLMAALVAGIGPGHFSVDHALGIADELNGFVGAAIAVVLGVAAGVGQLAAFYRPTQQEASA